MWWRVLTDVLLPVAGNLAGNLVGLIVTRGVSQTFSAVAELRLTLPVASVSGRAVGRRPEFLMFTTCNRGNVNLSPDPAPKVPTPPPILLIRLETILTNHHLTFAASSTIFLTFSFMCLICDVSPSVMLQH